MILKLDRIAKQDAYTIGHLYIDNKYFCDTIEDKVRDLSKEKKYMARQQSLVDHIKLLGLILVSLINICR